jgi:tetratricopeptide (TPR) repeat protein
MRFFKVSNKTHRKVDHYKSEVWRWVTMPFHVIVMFFSSVGAVIAGWWNNRNLRYLLQGLPSLLVFVGVVVLAVFCVFQDRALLARDYQIQATKSRNETQSLLFAKRDAAKPLALAQTCYNRLTILQPDSADNRYYLAVSYQQRTLMNATKAKALDDKIKAATDPEEKKKLQKEFDLLRDEIQGSEAATLRLMNHLAPPDRKGYGQAHLWMFEHIYRLTPGPDGRPQPPSPLAILEAERHLIRALDWPDEAVRVKANFGLARLYRDTNRIDDAKKRLTEVAVQFPEYRLILAQWAKLQNENELVQSHAKAAENAFRHRLSVSTDDHEARFGLVACLLLQAKFAEAKEMIDVGATLSSGSTTPELVRAYARKMTELLILWVDAKENDTRSNILERLQMLEQALRLDPDNPELFNRLLKLSKDKSPQAEKARETLHRMAGATQGSFLAHLFLGIDAWQQDKVEEARYHWEKAFALSDGAPIVANNLAWLLAFSPPTDLPRALELADAAVKKVPTEPRFRGTRGHILAKLNRNKEALEDLQESVKAYPKDPNLFKVLSEVTTKLGFTQMAENYRKEADRLSGLASGEKLSPTAPAPKNPDAAGNELKPPTEPAKDGEKKPSKPPA